MKIGLLEIDKSSKRGGNIGEAVIVDTLSMSGHMPKPCSPSEIDDFDLVITSLPSTYHIIDYLRMARKYNFERRRAKILMGGFGVQNPTAIRPYFDFAYFGRAHSDIVDVAQKITKDGDIEHDSILSSRRWNKVTVSQSPLCDQVFAEKFTGCPYRCKFCHYTYARKRQSVGKSKEYVQGMLTNGSPEMMFKDLVSLKEKQGRIRTAIDGFSHRLRKLYGKDITNEQIIATIDHIGSLGARSTREQFDLFSGSTIVTKEDITVMLVYNIGHFPGETRQDIEDLHDTVQQCNPANRIVVIIHTTPFRPSLLTPMQWEPVRVWPQWSDKREHTVRDDKRMLCKYSFSLEGAFSHMSSVIIDRISDHDDPIIGGILSPKGTTSEDKAKWLLSTHDASRYLRAYDIDEGPVFDRLSSHTSNERLAKEAHRIKSVRDGWHL